MSSLATPLGRASAIAGASALVLVVAAVVLHSLPLAVLAGAAALVGRTLRVLHVGRRR